MVRDVVPRPVGARRTADPPAPVASPSAPSDAPGPAAVEDGDGVNGGGSIGRVVPNPIRGPEPEVPEPATGASPEAAVTGDRGALGGEGSVERAGRVTGAAPSAGGAEGRREAPASGEGGYGGGQVPAGAVPGAAVPGAAVPSGAVPSGGVPSGAGPGGVGTGRGEQGSPATTGSDVFGRGASGAGAAAARGGGGPAAPGTGAAGAATGAGAAGRTSSEVGTGRTGSAVGTSSAAAAATASAAGDASASAAPAPGGSDPRGPLNTAGPAPGTAASGEAAARAPAGPAGAAAVLGGGSPAGAGAALVAEVVERTNAERAAVGCPPLAIDARLSAAAQAHSEDMARRNYFAHTAPDGESPFDRIAAAGYGYSVAAENIAAGQRTPAAVVAAWMASPGHRANIVACELTQIGVGHSSGGYYGTYWVEDFGTP
ncbi:CAP domain-containing protein [Frankia sp. EI5c]|uniref:CAP domain-containing protein n=1 Tax=Frankia sp. EI5c TaxID=683316 RepID=UPI0028C4A330|nr:CAP domain-containing protein [Frankia sp. EI5c]